MLAGVLASALGARTTAARRAASKLHRSRRDRPESAKEAIDWAEKVIFANLWMSRGAAGYWLSDAARIRGSSLPFRFCSAISPTFIARLIKGCRVDVRADICHKTNNLALSTL
jgi:hypothetical protein